MHSALSGIVTAEGTCRAVGEIAIIGNRDEGGAAAGVLAADKGRAAGDFRGVVLRLQGLARQEGGSLLLKGGRPCAARASLWLRQKWQPALRHSGLSLVPDKAPLPLVQPRARIMYGPHCHLTITENLNPCYPVMKATHHAASGMATVFPHSTASVNGLLQVL